MKENPKIKVIIKNEATTHMIEMRLIIYLFEKFRPAFYY